MSRYGFESDKGEAIVGWDNPFQTLFGEVNSVNTMFDQGRMGDNPIIIIDELAELLDMTIPEDIIWNLIDDMKNKTGPTPLQKQMRAIFE